MKKYILPGFLEGKCDHVKYQRWLSRKAMAHVVRDRKRNNSEATREAYMLAIHQAVIESDGLDAYTGMPLHWNLISTYNNEDSKAGRRIYKHSFGDLPTVDHIGDGTGKANFKICSWRVNDAKHDLSYEDFVKLCRLVVAFADVETR